MGKFISTLAKHNVVWGVFLLKIVGVLKVHPVVLVVPPEVKELFFVRATSVVLASNLKITMGYSTG